MGIVGLYLLFVVGGVLFEAIGTKVYFSLTKKNLHKSHFKLARYFFLLTFPLLGTLVVINLQGLSLFKIFIAFSIIGPVFEWLVGFSYYQVVGARLWTYKKFSYLGHSSILAAPLWGMAGVLFFLLAQKLV